MNEMIREVYCDFLLYKNIKYRRNPQYGIDMYDLNGWYGGAFDTLEVSFLHKYLIGD